MPIDQAMALLKQAERERWNENRMRIEARRARWFQPVVGPDVVDDLAQLIEQRCRFRGILADPPWPWERAGGAAGASTSYYPTMPIEELCALPVAQVANDEAFLMLWCPPAGLEEHGLPLLRAWGFSYKTSACWDKMTGGFGVGAYWRMEHELLLLGVRANSPTRFCDDNMSSMIRAKRSRQHSEKPVDAHRMMERSIVGPYLELFARRRVPGWTCCGNQLAPADDNGHLLAAD